jgi:uncharacterized Rmd1/YagE family protein
MKAAAVKKKNADIKSEVSISAYHIADSINLKQFKSDFTGKLISSSSSELFFSIEGGGYLYIFNYGNVAFANVSDVEKSRILIHLKNYLTNPISDDIVHPDFYDDYMIRTHDTDKPLFDFDDLLIDHISEEIIKIVMLNVAQSVALDYYAHQSEMLLEKVNNFASQLETAGKIRLSKRNMLKFIGMTLNRKNRIIDNLYIFDVPESVWEDRLLTEINSGMIRIFDLRTRFKEVQSNFKNIEDSLSIFMELYQHRMSNILEWIIIILILIEVIDLFASKFKPYFF